MHNRSKITKLLIKKHGLEKSVFEIDGKQKVLTRTVPPSWYKRYAYVLEEEERIYEQPKTETLIDRIANMNLDINSEGNNHDNPEVNANEELVKKMQFERDTKIKCVMHYVDGNHEKSKKELGKLKRRSLETTDLPTSQDSFLSMYLDCNDKLLPDKNQKASKAIKLWKKAITTVRTMVRFWNVLSQISVTTKEIFNELDISTLDNTNNESVQDDRNFFDKTKYKRTGTSKAGELDEKCIMTLRDQENLRTKDGIEYTLNSLRTLYKSFNEFPLSQQLIFVTIGQFIDVPADRIIVRECQPPQNFHFLLTGRAVALKMIGSVVHGDQKKGTLEVIKVFEQGAVFGDDGIYDCELRPYSVKTAANCQILSVNIDDHVRYTLTPPNPLETPEVIRTLGSLEILQYFPISKLIGQSLQRNVIVIYFQEGKIITRRSNNSDYIFVVKSGHCRMLAQVMLKSSKVSPIFKNKNKIPSSEKEVSSEDPILNISESDDSIAEFYLRQFRKSLHRSILPKIDDDDESMDLNENRLDDAKGTKNSSDKNDTTLHSRRSMCYQTVDTEESGQDKWLFLKELREGDYFGIEDIDFGDGITPGPDIVLISEGCEMILLSKAFLMDNMTEITKEHLRKIGHAHPDRGAILHKLQLDEKWRSFKIKVRPAEAEKRFTPWKI